MQIPLSLGSYRRTHFPEAVTLNCHVEPAPTQQAKPTALIARSGYASFKRLGTSPARAIVSKAGLFADSALVIMGRDVYLLDATGAATPVPGEVAGLAIVDADMGQDADLNSEAWVATGSKLYRVTTTSAVEEAFPGVGGAGASSVCCFRGFVIAAEAGTDQVFVRIPGDTTWQPLSFVSAEYAPDKVIAIRKLGEQVWLLGQSSSEAWALNDTATPPLAPYGGLVFDIGCRSRASAVSMPGALIWVDDACQVQLTTGGAPRIISDFGLAEQIRTADADDIRGSWYQKDGHTYYVLSLQGATTWVYDLTTQQWARRSTLGFSYSRISMFATLGDTVLAGSSVANEIYKLDPNSRLDAGAVFPVEFTAFAEVPEDTTPCNNVELACEVGQAPYEGAGSDPVIQMRWSDDEGKSWSGWRERPLGKAGQSFTRVRWNALGRFRRLRIFHFRVSDPVGRRFSDLRMNAS